MYKIKTQINDQWTEAHELLEPGTPTQYGTEFEAKEAVKQAADAFQAKHGGDIPYHDKHGLSTVYNLAPSDNLAPGHEYTYACFSFSETGE
jgi:hypothetical protein